MTYTVGIDIAKYEHVASVTNSITGELLVDSLHFDNSIKGFKTLLSNISNLDKEDVLIGFESTAHYHQTLFNYLTSKKYKCILINPYMTSRFRSMSLRNAKNDNIDSRSISQFLSFNFKDLETSDFVINDLKEACTERHELKQECSKLKIQLIANLDKCFPELESIVGKAGIHSNAIRAILKQYSSASSISNTRIDKLLNIANDASMGKYKESKIRKIKEVAKTSVGYYSKAIEVKIQHLIQSLESIEKQIDETEFTIVNCPTVINSPLHQIKGINSIEIGYIMSAIFNIQRFSSPEKLVAFAGLDPIVRQSGTWQATHTRMSKRGNKLLRYALIWTANNVRKHDGPIKDYYVKKRSEGKSHYNALGHCATKLISYIFYILNNPDKEFKFKR